MAVQVLKKAMNKQFKAFRDEAAQELQEISSWWHTHMVDQKYGGFYGSVNNEKIVDEEAPRGIVLYSRICWTFAALFQFRQNQEDLWMADRAFNYICENFADKQYGGAFWSVSKTGQMLDGKKQIYGLAFTVYAFAEYYKATGKLEALERATQLFSEIERYSYDKDRGGYVEAFSRDWTQADDLRLSEKDANEKKTMNTHLHIIEAYANLYTIWPDKILYQRLLELLDMFEQHIIHKDSGHLQLFFGEDWHSRSTLVSFGHDIEAAWLLEECALATGNKEYLARFQQFAIKIADAALEGWDHSLGGLWYEYDPATKAWVFEKHWWPQAEAMVGFFNAYQRTGNENYFNYARQSFNYILKELKDANGGEWFWGKNQDGTVMEKEKAGFWKCPYHSVRACLEIIRRIDSTQG